jgi:hypothetical protein
MPTGPDLFAARSQHHRKLKGPIFSEEDCERLCAFYAVKKETRPLRNFDFWLCVKGCSGKPITETEEDL